MVGLPLDEIPMGIALSQRGTFLQANAAFLKLFGYETGSELLGRPLVDHIAPQQRDFIQGVNQERERVGGGPAEYETLGMRKDGSIFPMQVHASTVPLADGLATLACITDISERKKDEEALRQSQQQLQVIFETLEAGLMLISPEGRISYANRRMAAMFGMPLMSLIDSAYLDHLYETEKPQGQARLRQIIAGEVQSSSLERRYLRADGTDFWGHLSGRRMENPDGSLQALVAVITDISDRKQAEEAMRVSENRLRLTLDATRIGTWDWDVKNDRWYASRIYYEMLGYEPETGVRDREVWVNRVHPDDRQSVREKIDAILTRTTTSYSYEARFMHVDGSYRWIQSLGFVVESDASGSPTRMVGIRKDITERKEAEDQQKLLLAQLHQAQKMESLGALAGGVAHDMNNVLGAILGLASAHIKDQPPGSKVQKAFGTIIKAAERGGNMLKGLLSFARQSSAEERDLDLNTILREEVRLLERTTLSKVRLSMDLDPGLWLVRADAGALTHAFMNLCVNAVDAMPENGTLTLRTRNRDLDWVEVQVQDTGTGMTPGVLAKALDPFFTTKEVGKGTGLGLSIVYSTVKAQKGKLELESEPGRGTCVTMHFPAIQGAAAPIEASGAYETMPWLGSLNVLLVDDDELIRSSMQGMLEALDHQTTLATSGEEALAKVEAGLRPDVIILDMNMPGLGGAGTLPRLRALLPKVPVLLSTGRADQAAQNLIKNHPFVTLLSKPFGLDELQAHLDPFIG
jgi:PAS domain S-box-containing protein